MDILVEKQIIRVYKDDIAKFYPKIYNKDINGKCFDYYETRIEELNDLEIENYISIGNYVELEGNIIPFVRRKDAGEYIKRKICYLHIDYYKKPKLKINVIDIYKSGETNFSDCMLK